jgi:hypothetical protein
MTTESNGRKFDWRANHDPRSKGFAIRDELGDSDLRSHSWRPGPILDQGNDGACVGFSWTGEALASPVRVNINSMRAERGLPVLPSPYEFAMERYHRAQVLDEYPGEDYEGSSVNGGAKAMREVSLLLEYKWCFGVRDVALAIGWRGPVVLGINWYESMFTPDLNGFVTPLGKVAGGHAILCSGFDLKTDSFTLTNSWGGGWGVYGQVKISWDSLDKLLQEDGEACLPTRRSYGR